MRRSMGLIGWTALATIVGGCVSVTNPLGEAAPGCVPTPIQSIRTPSDLDFALDFTVGIERLDAVDVGLEMAAKERLMNVPTLKHWLVDHGLTGNEVHLEQRRAGSNGIPNLSVTAVRIEDTPASQAAVLSAETYAQLTLTPEEVAAMPEDKPAPSVATVGGRAVSITPWGTTRLAWFPHGEVLYVVLAANEELLAKAVGELPAAPPTPATVDCTDVEATDPRAATR